MVTALALYGANSVTIAIAAIRRGNAQTRGRALYILYKAIAFRGGAAVARARARTPKGTPRSLRADQAAEAQKALREDERNEAKKRHDPNAALRKETGLGTNASTAATQLHVRQKQRRMFFGPPQTLVDLDTGEKIEVMPTTLVGADTDFQKFWIGHILAAVDELSNAKMKCVWYILAQVDRHTNTLHQTLDEIAAGARVSRRSVIRTLRVLEQYDIIRRRLSVDAKKSSSFIHLNPNVIMAGSHGKRHAMLIRFQQMELPMPRGDEKVIPIKRKQQKKAS